jgi:hypothetical protein
MATLAQKIEAETKMRELLEQSGLPQPDHVEYGFTCIRLFFEETKTVVVIDIDEPGQFEDGDADPEAEVTDGRRTDVADTERSRRGRRLV